MVVGITESYPKATRLVLNDHELITPIQCPLKPITWEMPVSLAELGGDIPSGRSWATSRCGEGVHGTRLLGRCERLIWCCATMAHTDHIMFGVDGPPTCMDGDGAPQPPT